MSALHQALHGLAPLDFSQISPDGLEEFARTALAHAELVAASVPPPPGGLPFAAASLSCLDPNSARAGADMKPSMVRPPQALAEHESLWPMWNKRLDVPTKDNHLNMAVYKLAVPTKTKSANWFAFRTVLEGMGFEKWKSALNHEFDPAYVASLAPQPSVRSATVVRGLYKRVISKVGVVRVLQLTVRQPVSVNALSASSRPALVLRLTSNLRASHGSHSRAGLNPRQRICISIPLTSFVSDDGTLYTSKTAAYHSIELIREVPHAQFRADKELRRLEEERQLAEPGGPANSQSLASASTPTPMPGKRDSVKRNTVTLSPIPPDARKSFDRTTYPTRSSFNLSANIIMDRLTNSGSVTLPSLDRKIDIESNPVEWTVLTRPETGRSLSRLMGDRHYQVQMTQDAVRFLNWACPVTDFGSDRTDDDGSTGDRGERSRRDSAPLAEAYFHPQMGEKIRTNGPVGVVNSPPFASAGPVGGGFQNRNRSSPTRLSGPPAMLAVSGSQVNSRATTVSSATTPVSVRMVSNKDAGFPAFAAHPSRVGRSEEVDGRAFAVSSSDESIGLGMGAGIALTADSAISSDSPSSASSLSRSDTADRPDKAVAEWGNRYAIPRDIMTPPAGPFAANTGGVSLSQDSLFDPLSLLLAGSSAKQSTSTIANPGPTLTFDLGSSLRRDGLVNGNRTPESHTSGRTDDTFYSAVQTSGRESEPESPIGADGNAAISTPRARSRDKRRQRHQDPSGPEQTPPFQRARPGYLPGDPDATPTGRPTGQRAGGGTVPEQFHDIHHSEVPKTATRPRPTPIDTTLAQNGSDESCSELQQSFPCPPRSARQSIVSMTGLDMHVATEQAGRTSPDQGAISRAASTGGSNRISRAMTASPSGPPPSLPPPPVSPLPGGFDDTCLSPERAAGHRRPNRPVSSHKLIGSSWAGHDPAVRMVDSTGRALDSAEDAQPVDLAGAGAVAMSASASSSSQATVAVSEERHGGTVEQPAESSIGQSGRDGPAEPPYRRPGRKLKKASPPISSFDRFASRRTGGPKDPQNGRSQSTGRPSPGSISSSSVSTSMQSSGVATPATSAEPTPANSQRNSLIKSASTSNPEGRGRRNSLASAGNYIYRMIRYRSQSKGAHDPATTSISAPIATTDELSRSTTNAGLGSVAAAPPPSRSDSKPKKGFLRSSISRSHDHPPRSNSVFAPAIGSTDLTGSDPMPARPQTACPPPSFHRQDRPDLSSTNQSNMSAPSSTDKPQATERVPTVCFANVSVPNKTAALAASAVESKFTSPVGMHPVSATAAAASQAVNSAKRWRTLYELAAKENAALRSQSEELQRRLNAVTMVLGRSEDGRKVLEETGVIRWAT